MNTSRVYLMQMFLFFSRPTANMDIVYVRQIRNVLPSVHFNHEKQNSILHHEVHSFLADMFCIPLPQFLPVLMRSFVLVQPVS